MQNAKRYTPNSGGLDKFYLKGILLYILPLPVLFSLFLSLLNGNFRLIITNAISVALFVIGASLARRGFLIEREYKRSTLAMAPKIKYKTIASIVIALATFFTSYFSTANSIFLSILLGLVSFVGFYLYYGLDPKTDKVGELNIGVNAEDVINITSKAKKRVEDLKKLKYKIADPDIDRHLDTIISQTSNIIKSIEKDPNDLSRARKFFNVYLYRTEMITKEYQENLKKNLIDNKMKDNYLKLLKSVKDTIIQQKERLNEDDITKLDIQIEALTKQIKHEGV